MRFGILGPLLVTDDRGYVLVVGAHKQRALLALLLVHRGELVSTDRLVDLLWNERPPRSAAKTVQVYISNLRKVLGDAVITTQDHGYLLNSAADDIDASQFESLAASARRDLDQGDPASALRSLDQALGLWRGQPLADLAYEPFAQSTITRLDEAHATAIEDRIEARLALGDRGLVAELEALVREHPLRERLHVQLMRALYLAGRQAEALGVYQSVRARLHDELGLEPGPELRQVQSEILQHAPSLTRAGLRTGSAPRSAAATPNNLPIALTSFVGRVDDVGGVQAALMENRLVTLVGTGGVGKTRLALEAGYEALGAFADGVWLIELSGVSNASLVPSTVADALGIGEQAGRPVVGTVVEHLISRRALIIMDNCEHLIDACASLIAHLLASARSAQVLATSREPLNVAGELSWRVRSLTVPSEPNSELRTAVATESVRLFSERARAAEPGFQIGEDNIEAVVDVCRHLDGVPLAIELAAARLRTMTVADLASRLGDRFRVLTGGSRTALPRQRTLEATVSWSYDLLAPAERVLFNRVSIFAGGFTIDAAERVCVDQTLAAGDVLDLISRLAERSMITVERLSDGLTRYSLLETLRQFAQRKLLEQGGEDALRDRHLAWAVGFAQTATAPEQLAQEHDNLRAALDWAIQTGAEEAALQLAAGRPARHYEEYAQRYELLLPPSSTVPAQLAGDGLYGGGRLAFLMGDWQVGAERCASAVVAGRAAHDGRLTSIGLIYQALCLWGMDRDEEVLPLLREGLSEARAAADPEAEARALWCLAWLYSESDLERAEATAREGMQIIEQLPGVFDRGHVIEVLGFVLSLQTRFAVAAEELANAASLFKRISPQGCAAHILETGAAFAAMTEQLQLGAKLVGAAARIRDETAEKPRPWERAVRSQWLPLISAHLDTKVYDAEIQRGRMLERCEALDFAEVSLRNSAPLASVLPPD